MGREETQNPSEDESEDKGMLHALCVGGGRGEGPDLGDKKSGNCELKQK